MTFNGYSKSCSGRSLLSVALILIILAIISIYSYEYINLSRYYFSIKNVAIDILDQRSVWALPDSDLIEFVQKKLEKNFEDNPSYSSLAVPEVSVVKSNNSNFKTVSLIITCQYNTVIIPQFLADKTVPTSITVDARSPLLP